MRLTNMVLGLLCTGVVGAASLIGCGSSGSGTGGNGGEGTSSSTTSTGSNTTTTTTTTGTSSGGTCTAACCEGASCKAADKSCVGLVDNSGQTKFGLRMSQLDVTAPTALTAGIVAGIVSGAVSPSNAGCNLNGSATFNWLIQFDTTAMTLKTGGAKPVADATMGYSFVDEMVTQGAKTFHLQPITYTGVTPDASGKFTINAGQDLLVPIYLDAQGMSVVILPLKNSQLTMGTLSSSQNCIGTYNASGLDPANSCLPDSKHKAFVDGAGLSGLITLEDADTVVITTLSESLCVLLSQDPSTYGMMSNGLTVCKRDSSGKIVFQGDTCSMAGGTCKDSVSLSANFAASSVKINN